MPITIPPANSRIATRMLLVKIAEVSAAEVAPLKCGLALDGSPAAASPLGTAPSAPPGSCSAQAAASAVESDHQRRITEQRPRPRPHLAASSRG